MAIKWSKYMEKLSCAFFALFISACSIAESRSDLDVLIADGAYNVHRVKLEGPAVTQVSYDINIPYPGMAITTKKVQSLKQQGWHQCDLDKAKWEHFGDYSVTPHRLVHQYQLNFAKDNELITIVMRYLSVLPAADVSESKPDNATQHVIILHYDLSVKEVRHQMSVRVESCLGHK